MFKATRPPFKRFAGIRGAIHPHQSPPVAEMSPPGWGTKQALSAAEVEHDRQTHEAMADEDDSRVSHH